MATAAHCDGIAAALRGMAQRADFTGMLAEIACPTLVVVGRHDAISPPSEMAAMARAIPGAVGRNRRGRPHDAHGRARAVQRGDWRVSGERGRTPGKKRDLSVPGRCYPGSLAANRGAEGVVWADRS